MTKVVLEDLANLTNENTVITSYNTNNASVEAGFDKTLSRDGTTPNQMLAQLDMNSNRIINLPSALFDTDPVRLEDLQTYVADHSFTVTVNNNIPVLASNTFDTRTAVQSATIAGTINFIRTAGYSSTGDGGGALYKRVGSQPTHLGKVQSLDGTWWEYCPEGYINAKAFGAKPDGSTDCSAIFNSLLTFAAGRTIYIPGGAGTGAGYLFNSPLTTFASTVNLLGDGQTQTTSPGVAYPTQSTTFLINFNSGFLFNLDTGAPCVFRGISFVSQSGVRPMASGGGITITCSQGGLGADLSVYNCSFSYLYNPIAVDKGGGGTIEGCQFTASVFRTLIFTTSGGFEGGVGTITDNIFTEYPSNPNSVIHTTVGYGKISDNYIVGGLIGIVLDVQAGFSAGALEIYNNQMEEQVSFGVYITRSASNAFVAMLQIKNNEFSNISQTGLTGHVYITESFGGNWVDSTSITGNVFRSALGNSGVYIAASGGLVGTSIINNEIQHFGAGTTTGISSKNTGVGGTLGTPTLIYDNRFSGLVGPRYDTNTAATVRDTQGMTFAQVTSTSCANGSTIYCTDGAFGSNPLNNATGTGAFARRIAGTWVGT